MTTTNGMPSPAISRFSTLTLDMLSLEESTEAAQMSVQKATGRALPEDLTARVAAVSLGFPQHLHGYVQACLDALRKFGALDTDEAKQWAMAEGDGSRLACYEGRLQSFTPDEGIVLRQIAALACDRNGRIAWRSAAEKADAADIDASGRQLLAAAIQKGVLSLAEGSTDLVFPIPSLMNHLAGRVERS